MGQLTDAAHVATWYDPGKPGHYAGYPRSAAMDVCYLAGTFDVPTPPTSAPLHWTRAVYVIPLTKGPATRNGLTSIPLIIAGSRFRFVPPPLQGESFGIDVRVHWWQEMAIYVGNPDNRIPKSSVVAFISSVTCEARSGFVPPSPTIKRRTKSLFVLREVLTATQVNEADQALASDHCAYTNPVQDFRNSVTGPNLTPHLGNFATPTTIPPDGA